MNTKAKVHALIPAAGRGMRFGGEVPKQYSDLLGKPVLAHSIASVQDHPLVSGVTVMLAADDPWYRDRIAPLFPDITITPGGDSRAQSVLNGLRFITTNFPEVEWALVHDAARPCLHRAGLDSLLEQGLASEDGAILATPVRDTLKQSDARGRIERTIDRSVVWSAQTPQLFPVRALVANLESALSSGNDPTDEAAAMEAAGARPMLVENDPTNIKITGPQDLAIAEYILGQAADEE